MRNILIVLLLIVGINTMQANNTDPGANYSLSGQVVDENGNTLAGVEVIIEGLNKKVYTDFEGNFTFEGLKNGAYTIVTKFVSFKDSKSVVNTIQNSNEVAVIKLKSQQLKIN